MTSIAKHEPPMAISILWESTLKWRDYCADSAAGYIELDSMIILFVIPIAIDINIVTNGGLQY
jgi:hypothetical protein